MTTQLAEPLTAKKKFVNSLTYYKKYLGENHESSPQVQVEESRIVRPNFTVKRGRSVPRVRKVKPTIRKRKKMLVFTVQEVVAEEESSFEPEVVAEEEITPEKFVSIDIDKLSEDDFYKILRFLESEKKKLDETTAAPSRSWIKHSRKRVY